MKSVYRNRHCFAKDVEGQTYYYAVYGKETVEVNKEIYDCLKQSYEHEWSLERTERNHKKLSYDQLIEDIALLDRHGKQPMILCCTSAEEEYINDIESCEKAALFSRLQEEIQCLCSEDQSILTTYMTGSKGVSQVAQSLGISERTIYNRRQRIAKQIRKKVLKGCRK